MFKSSQITKLDVGIVLRDIAQADEPSIEISQQKIMCVYQNLYRERALCNYKSSCFYGVLKSFFPPILLFFLFHFLLNVRNAPFGNISNFFTNKDKCPLVFLLGHQGLLLIKHLKIQPILGPGFTFNSFKKFPSMSQCSY